MISVIIPCYNCEKTIIRCLDSIFNNSYKEIEVICVDDSSTDNTLFLLSNYNRIRVLKNTKNKGQGYSRNRGLDICCGEYVCFIDSDDYVEPNYFFTLLENIKDNDFCMCNFYNVSSDGKKEMSVNISNGIHNVDQFWNLNVSCPVTAVVPWNKLYKKELFNFVRFPENVFYEDEFFLTDVISHCKTISVINYCLYNYCQNPLSTMNTNAVYRKLYRVEARIIRCKYFLDNKMFNYYSLELRENLYLLLRIKDLSKKHYVFDVYKSQINKCEKNIKDVIFEGIDLDAKISFDIKLFAKCNLIFRFIYKFRLLARLILKRNYENA